VLQGEPAGPASEAVRGPADPGAEGEGWAEGQEREEPERAPHELRPDPSLDLLAERRGHRAGN
jgi:hypothetical protein